MVKLFFQSKLICSPFHHGTHICQRHRNVGHWKSLCVSSKISIVLILVHKNVVLRLQTRCVPDQVCEDYPEISFYLIDSEAFILHDKAFQSAVVKILGENKEQLSRVEQCIVSEIQNSSIQRDEIWP